MIKVASIVETYETGREDFLVDVVMAYRNGVEVRQVWAYRRSRGVKMICFSDVGTIPRTEFMTCVECIPSEFYEAYDRTLARWRGDRERMGEVAWI